jgi:hypothetical protein
MGKGAILVKEHENVSKEELIWPGKRRWSWRI